MDVYGILFCLSVPAIFAFICFSIGIHALFCQEISITKTKSWKGKSTLYIAIPLVALGVLMTMLVIKEMQWCRPMKFDNNSEEHEQAIRKQKELDCGRTEIEPKILKEKADTTNLASQLADLIVTNESVIGQWDSRDWHDGVHLTITPRKDAQYDVHYYLRGDLASWRLNRTATFHDGVLELNELVEEYCSSLPYKHFYMLKTQNGIRLVSQPTIRYWVLGKKQKDWNNQAIDQVMLIKTKPNQSQEKP